MRMRTLKPGFFLNETLADLSPLTRLFFAGLWCHADREGRIEDRPRTLKASIIPFDDFDTNKGLDDLAAVGFVIRYAINGKKYLQIVNFLKHQCPNVKESASVIPPVPEDVAASADTAQDSDKSDTVMGQVKCEHHTSTVLAPNPLSTSTSLSVPYRTEQEQEQEPNAAAAEESPFTPVGEQRAYQAAAAAASQHVQPKAANAGKFTYEQYLAFHRQSGRAEPEAKVFNRASWSLQNGRDDQAVGAWLESRAKPQTGKPAKPPGCVCNGSGYVFQRNGQRLVKPEICACNTEQ